jgi:hypothetical protein
MIPEEAVEQDHGRFTELIQQLNELLDDKANRLPRQSTHQTAATLTRKNFKLGHYLNHRVLPISFILAVPKPQVARK